MSRLVASPCKELAAAAVNNDGLSRVLQSVRVADLQHRADAWLADKTDAHDALRRLVIDGRDGVRRALAA